LSVIASKAWSGSGAEDPAAWAMNAGGTSDSWVAFTIALRMFRPLITASYGSFTQTCFDAILSQVHFYIIEPITGYYTQSGIAVALQKFWKMVSALGSYTLTGIATTITHVRTVGYQTGYFVLTGIAAKMGGFGGWKWKNQDKSSSSWNNDKKTF
jgi:hypothetical protein